MKDVRCFWYCVQSDPQTDKTDICSEGADKNKSDQRRLREPNKERNKNHVLFESPEHREVVQPL